MVRKISVETYLEPDTIAAIEATDQPVSAYIREAVNEKLERETQ